MFSMGGARGSLRQMCELGRAQWLRWALKREWLRRALRAARGMRTGTSAVVHLADATIPHLHVRGRSRRAYVHVRRADRVHMHR